MDIGLESIPLQSSEEMLSMFDDKRAVIGKVDIGGDEATPVAVTKSNIMSGLAIRQAIQHAISAIAQHVANNKNDFKFKSIKWSDFDKDEFVDDIEVIDVDCSDLLRYAEYSLIFRTRWYGTITVSVDLRTGRIRPVGMTN